MTALRIARAATGHDRIALFAGSYHGSFDGTMARPGLAGPPKALPMAPGVPASLLNDALLLEFGSPASLDLLRQHSGELDAVMMELIARWRPEMNPAFVRELREITTGAGGGVLRRWQRGGRRSHAGAPAGAAGRYPG